VPALLAGGLHVGNKFIKNGWWDGMETSIGQHQIINEMTVYFPNLLYLLALIVSHKFKIHKNVFVLQKIKEISHSRQTSCAFTCSPQDTL
jgi:hypothetical protein